MASLVDDLNELIESTRAVFEAAEAVADDIKCLDPDIEEGLEDIMDTERWSSSGLYHRINQLKGTANLLVGDFPGQVADVQELSEKIRMICRQEENIAHRAREILSRDDLDETTRELITELRRLHRRNAEWCREILTQWQPS